jgi:serine/threonine-protein kinase HipA
MEPYSSKVLFPFFDGLIPEGWLLRVTQETWKLDYRDRFGVLLAACGDCIGDVSIQREE